VEHFLRHSVYFLSMCVYLTGFFSHRVCLFAVARKTVRNRGSSVNCDSQLRD